MQTVIKQLSVFLQNRQGRLNEMTGVLARSGVNISALSIAENAEYGLMRMIVSDTSLAADALRAADFSVKITDVLCLETPDVPGALQSALERLAAAGINVSYMYGYSNAGVARLILRVSDPSAAISALG